MSDDKAIASRNVTEPIGKLPESLPDDYAWLLELKNRVDAKLEQMRAAAREKYAEVAATYGMSAEEARATLGKKPRGRKPKRIE